MQFRCVTDCQKISVPPVSFAEDCEV